MDAIFKGLQGDTKLGPTIIQVGRAPTNQLVMNDLEVSWLHAQICPQGQGYIVIDLGSTNGTFVNGQKLSPNAPHRLNDGDIVRFGNTSFSYLAGASAPPPAHPPTKRVAPVSLSKGASYQ